MKPEIKQRIEQIRRGEVPEGYKKTNIGIFPKEWRLYQLSQLLEFKNGINADKEKFGSGTKLISVRDILSDKPITYDSIIGAVDINDQQKSEFVVKYGDILFQRSSETYEEAGTSNVYLDEKRTAVFSGFVIRGKKIAEYNPIYLNALLRIHYVRKNIISNAAGAQHINIGQESLSKIHIALATDIEQQKIAKILATQDGVIELYKKKIEQLQLLKKVCLQKMFPKQGRNIPEVRFQEFTAPWQQRRLGEITYAAGEKNKDNLPLDSYSITNENGFVPQDELFENGGTMHNADKTMYYIVSPKSFAYNPARINIGSIGYLQSDKKVIVSSLYEVFKTTHEIDDSFLWHWLKSSGFQKLIEQYQEGGVRQYFYYDKFCKGKLYLPDIQEQRKIGVYFDNLDHLITLHQHMLDEEKRKKKALMQLLLTGIVRV